MMTLISEYEDRQLSREDLLRVLAQAQASLRIAQDQRDAAMKERDKFKSLAMTDALTGLRSLHAFKSDAPISLALARRNKRTFGFMIIDVVGLGKINNTYGLAEGDKTLQETSRAIMAAIRETDTAYHLHGDEFAVTFPDITPPEKIEEIGERIWKYVRKVDGLKVELSVSIGCATAKPTDTLQTIHDRAGYRIALAKKIMKRILAGASAELPIVHR